MATSYTYKGSGIVLSTEEWTNDPIRGRSLYQEWQGHPQACESLFEQFRFFPCKLISDGLPWRVQVTFSDSDDRLEEIPTVEWFHLTELVDRELFNLPQVQAEALTYINGAAAYRKDIKRYVDDGLPYTDGGFTTLSFTTKFPPILYPMAHQVWREMTRGVTDFQDAVQVVQRVRTASFRYPFQRAILSSRLVYSTAQLNIPNDIVTNFAAPPAQPNTTVGWRLRGQSFSLAGDKRTETIEFVLAAWSLLSYTQSSGNYT